MCEAEFELHLIKTNTFFKISFFCPMNYQNQSPVRLREFSGVVYFIYPAQRCL